MTENSDNQTTKFNCLSCDAPLVSKPWLLSSGFTGPQRVTCTYCDEEYLLPRPDATLYIQKLGNHTFLRMSNGDIYVSRDDGETWRRW